MHQNPMMTPHACSSLSNAEYICDQGEVVFASEMRNAIKEIYGIHASSGALNASRSAVQCSVLKSPIEIFEPPERLATTAEESAKGIGPKPPS